MEARRVQPGEAGQKLLRYLHKVLPEAPESFLYKMLRKKNIVLAGHGKCSGAEVLSAGDEVKFFLSAETFEKFGGKAEGGAISQEAAAPDGILRFAQDDREEDSEKGKEFSFGSCHSEERSDEESREALQKHNVLVLYEDEDFFFVSKPPGLLVQGDRSGEESLAGLLLELSEAGSTTKWAPMHRLDRNTSGLVLCGKTVRGQQFLANVLKERTVRKEYLALVRGHLPKEGSFRAWHRKNAKTNTVQIFDREMPGAVPIETIFTELARAGAYSLVRAELVTGRSHQIRAHLAHLGCPILGDAKYGGLDARFPKVHSQLLHAERVIFQIEGWTEDAERAFARLAGKAFTAPVPESMKGVLDQIGFRRKDEGK